MSRRIVFLASILLVAPVASAQTDNRLVLGVWDEKAWGETFDQFNFQFDSDVKDTDDTASVFFWDSIGRFRLDSSTADAWHIGYRYVTVNFDTDSDTLPNHLDEVSVAVGIRLGQVSGGKLSTILGMGWSGDHPFADSEGIFGLAHLLWEKPLNKTDSLVLSIDWDGAGAFLPDVPLPGFAWIRRQENWRVQFGYPRSALTWELMENLKLDAYYMVPYTGDVTLDYALTKNWHLYGEASNFFNGFRQDDEPATNRVFFEMSRIEAGIRFMHGDFVLKGAYFDMGLSVGYAFHQQFFNGFDVRDIDQTAELTDAPYLGLVVRGKF